LYDIQNLRPEREAQPEQPALRRVMISGAKSEHTIVRRLLDSTSFAEA
jgi:hypothetical protein